MRLQNTAGRETGLHTADMMMYAQIIMITLGRSFSLQGLTSDDIDTHSYSSSYTSYLVSTGWASGCGLLFHLPGFLASSGLGRTFHPLILRVLKMIKMNRVKYRCSHRDTYTRNRQIPENCLKLHPPVPFSLSWPSSSFLSYSFWLSFLFSFSCFSLYAPVWWDMTYMIYLYTF